MGGEIKLITLNLLLFFIAHVGHSFSFLDLAYLYDLINDPHEKINLVNKNQYNDIKNNLEDILRKWMKEQDDFISDGNLQLIKPTRHPLDKITKWNTIPKNLENILMNKDYMKSHY